MARELLVAFYSDPDNLEAGVDVELGQSGEAPAVYNGSMDALVPSVVLPLTATILRLLREDKLKKVSVAV